MLSITSSPSFSSSRCVSGSSTSASTGSASAICCVTAEMASPTSTASAHLAPPAAAALDDAGVASAMVSPRAPALVLGTHRSRSHVRVSKPMVQYSDPVQLRSLIRAVPCLHTVPDCDLRTSFGPGRDRRACIACMHYCMHVVISSEFSYDLVRRGNGPGGQMSTQRRTVHKEHYCRFEEISAS